MQDLNDLYYFSQVVEQGGFSAAARALDIPKSRLSRRISPWRKAWACACCSGPRGGLTAAGERYLHYCRNGRVGARADDAMRQLQSSPPGRWS